MDKLRIGVVGVGSVVREIYQHLYYHSEYSSIIQVAGIADPNGKALHDFGDAHDIPRERRFPTHVELMEKVPLDLVMVNTPDHLHHRPVVDALNRGLDVLVPKPTADNVRDCHDMIETARRTRRLLGVDFHKREDPRFKEAAARFREGRYGAFQLAVFYMLDKIFVVDPNREPRFFASPDFASVNTPVSFLCVHMADALLHVVRLKPRAVRATGFKQKLPSLRPIPVDGYDMVDTEVLFDSGAVAHIIAGWHIPDAAHAATVQSARIICTEGYIDLGIDSSGYREVVPGGIAERNTLFLNREPDGNVSGYGISSPGKFLRRVLQARTGRADALALAESLLDPFAVGFYTVLILQGAHESLAQGRKTSAGVVGGPVDLGELLVRELGRETASRY